MPASDSIMAPKLKCALQKKNAKRRSRNNAETKVADALARPPRNDLQPKLLTEMRPIDALNPSKYRTRVTKPELLAKLISSISQYGLILPILVDRDGNIIAGHGLWEAAKKLGIAHIECKVVDHLDSTEAEALALMLNRTGEVGTYDLEMLRERMIVIKSAGISLASTGFEIPEIDQILKSSKPIAESEGDDDNDEPALVSVLGDLILLGMHRLLCGDSTVERSYERALNGKKAHASFGDAPYNCKIENFVSGLGKNKHKDFQAFCGNESDEEFLGFLTQYLSHTKAWTTEGAVIFACMDFRQLDLLAIAGRQAGLSRNQIVTWNKGSGGMTGSLYRSASEFVMVLCNGKSPATNNVNLGVWGRDRTSVWTYPGANRRGSSAAQALASHPTPKPVPLVEDAILDVTNPGEIVLDPFCGSGTTILAAELTGRIGCGIEIDPKYVDAAVRRWEKLTGEDAIHEATGLTFTELAKKRAGAGD